MRNKENFQLSKDEIIRQQRVDVLALKRLDVINEQGQKVPFRSFWEKKIVIVIFVRHFSCIACRAHADQIWKLHQGGQSIDTRIVFIGNGEHYLIKAFKEDMNLHGAEIYTDPSLETFDACGMNRSFKNLISLKTLMGALKLKKQGYSQGKFNNDSGSHRQFGGVVAFKKPGRVIYHFTSKYLGDFDNPKDWPKAFQKSVR